VAIGHSIGALASGVMQITGLELSCSYLFFYTRKLDYEIKEIEAKISQKSRGLSRKAIQELCGICFKVKVASTEALICRVCSKKTCTRCGNSKEVRRIIRNAIAYAIAYPAMQYQLLIPQCNCLSR